MAKTCVGCAYYRPLYDNKGESYCNYILDTGEPRGCPAKNCTKKISMEEYMKRLTQEQKQEIIRLRIEGNVPVKVIAEKFHLSKSAVFNIISKWKEHGDSVIYDDGKEPDTVAAVTDSEQENTCEDIPADIVSQETENVKADDDLLPCAVVDAVANEIDRLYDRLTECDREMQRIKDARANAENDLNELKTFLRKNGYVEIVKMLASNAEWRALQGESANSL